MLKSLAGGALFGEVWGSGTPEVLVLHGWARTHADFAAVVGPGSPRGALATLAPDLPGFGSTPAPPTAWGAADYAGALVPLLEETAGRPVVVLGHSRGGCIAVALAAARPDLVRGLVLTGAPLLPRPGPARKPAAAFRWARRLHRLGLLGEETMEKYRKRYGSADYRSADGIMRDVFVRMVNERYDDQLAAVAAVAAQADPAHTDPAHTDPAHTDPAHTDPAQPVALVWGEDDPEVPLAVAEAVMGRIPGATLSVWPGAGHLTPLTVPDALRTAVETALAPR